jgi:hypothetical protein
MRETVAGVYGQTLLSKIPNKPNWAVVYCSELASIANLRAESPGSQQGADLQTPAEVQPPLLHQLDSGATPPAFKRPGRSALEY